MYCKTPGITINTRTITPSSFFCKIMFEIHMWSVHNKQTFVFILNAWKENNKFLQINASKILFFAFLPHLQYFQYHNDEPMREVICLIKHLQLHTYILRCWDVAAITEETLRDKNSTLSSLFFLLISNLDLWL